MFSVDDKKKMLKDLVEVEGFEQYLHTKFPGAKRFSVEGGDASIICLDKVIELSALAGASEAVLGLAHRGRLSTLAKVMQKPYCAIFSEFMGSSAFPSDLDIAGDVKYHMGYSSDKVINENKTIHLSLTPNPSHLEAVNPVVAGKFVQNRTIREKIERQSLEF
jgi:2-oxoglutarate dehydrogenase E1 component